MHLGTVASGGEVESRERETWISDWFSTIRAQAATKKYRVTVSYATRTKGTRYHVVDVAPSHGAALAVAGSKSWISPALHHLLTLSWPPRSFGSLSLAESL